MSHHEIHRSHRVGWLRVAVLGANDGIVSTASLIIGVAAASTSHENILLAGVAGLVAVSSLVFLAFLGGLAAKAGGASTAIGAFRVTFWGALAMALTAGVGTLFGVVA
jgi:VIT1/CCC1 family predicted Fe2+/Mn2+ transporter